MSDELQWNDYDPSYVEKLNTHSMIFSEENIDFSYYKCEICGFSAWLMKGDNILRNSKLI